MRPGKRLPLAGVILLSIAMEGVADGETNLALGKPAFSFPVISHEAGFYERLTDGDPESSSHWRGWSKSAYLVVDLGKPQPLDAVRVHCSNVSDYFAGWFNLKPPLKLYIGDRLDRLRFVEERNPAANYEPALIAERGQGFVQFDLPGSAGRYVVLHFFVGWGVHLKELEVVRTGAPPAEQIQAGPVYDLEELWRRRASLSAWLPMSTEVVTPHIRWARPCARGRLKTLFVMGKGQFRLLAELEQRMDLDWDWIPILWGGAVDHPEVSPFNRFQERDALTKLSGELDLIVLAASVQWADLPGPVRTRILEQIAGGAGLIYVDPLESSLLPDIVALRDAAGVTPEDEASRARYALDSVRLMKPLPADFLRSGIHGEGRVAWLTYDHFLKQEKWNFSGSGVFPELAAYPEMPSPAENFYAFFADLAYRTAGRPAPVCIQRAELTDRGLVLEVAGAGLTGFQRDGLAVHLEVRDKHYEDSGTFVRRLDDAEQAEVIVPRSELDALFRKGPNLLNLRVQDVRGAVHDWAIVPYESQAPGIRDVETAPGGYPGSGEPFSVVLDGPESGDRVTAEAYDGYERLVWEASTPVDGRERVPFVMDVSDAMSTAVRLRTTLWTGADIVDRVSRVVPRGLDGVDSTGTRYGFDVWGEAPTAFSRPWQLHVLQTQRDAGVEGTLAYANYYASQELDDDAWDRMLDDFFALFTINGLRPIFQYSAGVGHYCARNVGNRLWKPKNEEESHMILGDPAFMEQYVEHVNRNVDVGRKWGITAYSSGDEQQGWMSFHPTNIAAFREHLRERYGDDVAALNRSWGSAFDSFDDAEPTKLGNIGEGLSRVELEEGRGSFEIIESDEKLQATRGAELYSIAPWMEYRLFMDDLFARVHGETVTSFAERDEGLRFGLDGTRYAGAIGFDWPKLLANVNDIVCYNEPVQAEVIRDYQRPGMHSASFVGYDTHDKDELWATSRSWLDLIRGLKGISYYASSGYRAGKTVPHHRFGLVAEDLRLSHSGAIHAREVAEIRRGIDALIFNARPVPYRAAVRYSQACLAAGDFVRANQVRNLSNGYHAAPSGIDELKGVERIMIDLGLHWRYVTDRELREGFLEDHEAIELLVIPYGVCIDEEEVEAALRLLQRGGTVVATGEFGIFDLRGTAHEADLRDRLFGVRAANNQWMKAGDARKSTVAVRQVAEGRADYPVIHEELSVSGAEVVRAFVDGTPAVIERGHGTGRAVYMNTAFSGYDAYLPVYVPGPYHDPRSRRESLAREHRELFRTALGRSADARSVTIETDYYPETPAPYYRIAAYGQRDGGVLYGFLQEHFRRDYYVVNETRLRPGEGLDCRLTFDREGHIFDVRAKRYLGYGREVEANIHPCVAAIYAVLPHRPVALQLDAPERVERGKPATLRARMEYEVQASSTVEANVHLRFHDPRGEEVSCYARNLLLDGPAGDAGEATIRFALNDLAGAWRITAEDTVSGNSDQRFIVVDDR